MGWSNLVPIFHNDVTYILQPEIPHQTIPYINDVPINDPNDWKIIAETGKLATHPANPGIRLAIWEFFQDLNRILQRMKYCGGTSSGKKLQVCVEQFKVLERVCMPQGRLPEISQMELLCNWGPCKDILELRAWLGT
ncbi:hypothetical protein H0H81_007122, partial [Sphagnurus paluster]